MAIYTLLLLLGLALLISGASWFVQGASAMAKKYHVSDLAIGLTVVALGTSIPELVINMIAAAEKQPDIVIGNVIGSNSFNLFLILGIVGLILPVSVRSSTVKMEIPISLVATILLWVLLNNYILMNGDKILSRMDGLVLLTLFALFIWYVFNQIKSDPSDLSVHQMHLANGKIIVFIVSGLVGLFIGGKFVLNNAVLIATDLGLSKKLIGLTIIAAGTSLPELITSVVAALQKKSDIAIGNVIGSNIINVLLITSTSALIHPISYNSMLDLDIYFLMGGTLFLLLAMFTGGRKKLDRWEAAILLISFLIYTSYQVGKEL